MFMWKSNTLTFVMVWIFDSLWYNSLLVFCHGIKHNFIFSMNAHNSKCCFMFETITTWMLTRIRSRETDITIYKVLFDFHCSPHLHIWCGIVPYIWLYHVIQKNTMVYCDHLKLWYELFFSSSHMLWYITISFIIPCDPIKYNGLLWSFKTCVQLVPYHTGEMYLRTPPSSNLNNSSETLGPPPHLIFGGGGP